MDERTGEIYDLADGGLHHHHANGQPIRANLIPLSEREASHLKGREAKDRIAELKRMRKQAIRDAKALIGRKLRPEEIMATLESCEA